MNLTVSESDRLLPLTLQIFQTHSDHSRLLFFDIHEFNETFLTAGLKVPPTLRIIFAFVKSRGTTSCVVCQVLVEHHLDVPLANLQLVVLNDV